MFLTSSILCWISRLHEKKVVSLFLVDNGSLFSFRLCSSLEKDQNLVKGTAQLNNFVRGLFWKFTLQDAQEKLSILCGTGPRRVLPAGPKSLWSLEPTRNILCFEIRARIKQTTQISLYTVHYRVGSELSKVGILKKLTRMTRWHKNKLFFVCCSSNLVLLGPKSL